MPLSNAPFSKWLLLDSRGVNVPMAYNPFFVLLSSMKPLFFNSLTLIGSKYSVNPCPTSEAKAFPSKSWYKVAMLNELSGDSRE